MKKMTIQKGFQIGLLLIFSILLSAPSWAAAFYLNYEQAVTDSYGNEIGYRTVQITSPDQLPVGNQWRDYLKLKLPNGKTVFDYASETARYLSKPLNMTISDRSSVCYSSKSSYQYNLNLYKYINNYSTDWSKQFIFLHEFGHIAMLNGYPYNYDFAGLDYGDDNKHYMDEILPNANTAWVEGWANAFAASKNNGYVFSMDMKSSSVVAFLKDNSFEEMSRNELFVGKVTYDAMSKLSGGQTKVFDSISKSGPHYSLKEFCAGYTRLYPADKVGLAQILIENSQGKISLNEILSYVNGGSRTVSRDLYNVLATKGYVKPTTTTTAQPTNNNQTSNTTTASTNTSGSSSSSSGSIWDRIFGWFSGLFGSRARTPVEPTSMPAMSGVALPPMDSSAALAPSLGSETTSSGAIAPAYTGTYGVDDLVQAQENYYKAFAEYNKAMQNQSSNSEVKQALQKLKEAKDLLKKIKSCLK